ncbi:MAG: hypothetical protein IJT21_06710 [Synergistaceae bacterium]|nr:hypothetical protein [Synergistaceae bacterium]
MKNNLLDKEVLCAYDIRAIQKYIFESSNNRDIIGSGYVISTILQNAISYAMKQILNPNEYCIECDSDDVPYFQDNNIKAQVLEIVAGNAFILYRTGRICQAATRIINRYFIENTYSLQMASACTEKSEKMNDDWDNLYKELDRIKNSSPFSIPFAALPIVRKEKILALPVAGFDKVTGDAISRKSLFQRAPADHRNNINIEKQAFIHIDGNSMGLTIAQILSSKDNYLSEIMTKRRISENIARKITEALYVTEKYLQDKMSHDGRNFIDNYCRLHVGGDDVNIICHADYAMDLVEIFVREISRTPLWDDEKTGKIYLTVCAGIGYTTGIKNFGLGMRLAEQCCEIAKKEAKKRENLINGRPGNWVDFQINNDKYINDVDAERESSYKISRARNLCLRPYCLDDAKKDSPAYYGNLKGYMRVFSENIRSDSIRKEFRDAYLLNPEIINILLLKYKDLFGENLDLLGRPYLSVPNREGLFAAWYDALELITRR